MTSTDKYLTFNGRLLIVDSAASAKACFLLLRHIDMPASRISVVTADTRGLDIAAEYGVAAEILPLTRDNYRDALTPRIGKGDFVLNLSVDVSSLALVEFCQEVGALYLDTCIEPWPGGYTDPALTPSQRSNYALRQQALDLRARAGGNAPTAIVTHGANPGLVSYFVKQALLNIARDTGAETAVPASRAEWAGLARRLGVKVVHVAERDTQVAAHPKQRGEFVNTWSVDGFVSEGCQPAELGWGTHEKALPADGARHDFGPDCAIYLNRPGAATRVRTWTPLEGPFHGFLITHNEAISISDYFTVVEDGRPVYRPTCHYAYHPCDDAVLSLHEFAGKTWTLQENQRLMVDELVTGRDELGVLLAGHAKGAYWYGSQLSIEEARELVPHNNATSLQVTAAVLAGVIWALKNPAAGLLEADEIDFRRMLEICTYLGTVTGAYTDWTPLDGRGVLFPEDLDREDPWQFKNIRVV